jgi:GNAT superfamily N-acetyltransferase
MSDFPAIQIRPAVVDDVPLIFALIRELAVYEHLDHTITATEQSLRETLFSPDGKPTGAEIRIASFEGKPAGFALFFPNYSTFVGRPGIYLEDLFVRPEFRGKGVGRALLREVAALAVQRNCGRLEWAVLDWNSPAIGFYKKLGAVPMDDWTVFRVVGDALKKLADSGE